MNFGVNQAALHGRQLKAAPVATRSGWASVECLVHGRCRNVGVVAAHDVERIHIEMKDKVSRIRFKAKLLRPATPKRASWTFLILPKNASARLPTRSMTTVSGTINDYPFRATLAPDGHRSHWLKVSKKMREGANAKVGEVVSLEIESVGKEPEPRVPQDLSKALAAAPEARALWSDIMPVARRDWIHWITSAKKSETRARRIANACEMLAAGKRRVCCFDRTGIYSKNLGAPQAAD